MIIKVKGYASFKKFTARMAPHGGLIVPEDATVASVLEKLQVPVDLKVVVMVNGRHRTLEHILGAGDRLVFFPPLEGG